ncbi:hypothetical protein J2S50_005767 [Streptomyces sp. DSM 40167]|nr:hypothetical protein [Streptomyces sp. DSM 40167]
MGEYACTRMLRSSQKASSSAGVFPACRSTWFTCGATVPWAKMFSRSDWRKFDTPMARILPALWASSSARHAWRLPSA